jgi:hypothetical protein
MRRLGYSPFELGLLGRLYLGTGDVLLCAAAAADGSAEAENSVLGKPCSGSGQGRSLVLSALTY